MAAFRRLLTLLGLALVCVVVVPGGQATPANARLTNDNSAGGGYVSDYTLVTGNPYTDDVLTTCSQSRGRQNEPSVAVDPRNPQVIVGSSNDYCPVFNADGTFLGLGDIWLGYYRSENGGSSFHRSLDVAQGSAAPNLLGKFHDKTAIEVDRTGGPCDGYVYFAWARFTGGGPNGFNSSVYFSRSTDHGATFSAPMKLSQTVHGIQFPDISVPGNGHVYVTYRQFADVRSHSTVDAIAYNASTNCGASFSSPRLVQAFEPYDPTDISVLGGISTDCGDFAFACISGYTFMRGGTQVRSTADQHDTAHDYVYVAYDPSIPGTEVPSGTTYGSITSEDLPAKYHRNVGSQSGIYFFRLNGATGAHTAPVLIDDPRARGGLQRFPDISVDAGRMHALWWDSRNDACYSPARPLGNCANKSTVPSIDAYSAAGVASTLTWSPAVRLSDVTSNPNWEQFGGRSIPFGGDYLYISSVGAFSY